MIPLKRAEWWRLDSVMHITVLRAYSPPCYKHLATVFREIRLSVAVRNWFATSLAVQRRFLFVDSTMYLSSAGIVLRTRLPPWRLLHIPFVWNDFQSLKTTLWLNFRPSSILPIIRPCVKSSKWCWKDMLIISSSSIDSFPLNFAFEQQLSIRVKSFITLISAITWRRNSLVQNLHTHNTPYRIPHLC